MAQNRHLGNGLVGQADRGARDGGAAGRTARRLAQPRRDARRVVPVGAREREDLVARREDVVAHGAGVLGCRTHCGLLRVERLAVQGADDGVGAAARTGGGLVQVDAVRDVQVGEGA